MITTAIGIILIWAGAVMMLSGIYQYLALLICSQMIADEHKGNKYTFNFKPSVAHIPSVIILAGVLVLALL